MSVAITIKDVAKQANVSVATVSRALNGHQNVAVAVRKRVEQVASLLQYSPHHAARSLSSRRTNTIGVVLPDLHGEFFSELIRGIDQVVRERSLHLLVSSHHGNPEEQGEALRAMRGRVDGLLVMSPFAGCSASLDQNLGHTMPAVLINSDAPADHHPSLCVDNYGGALVLMQHLIDAGHRRIAFIAGPDDNFDARERMRGYLDALADRLPAEQPWILPGAFDEASGNRAGLELLASARRPDAVFAANDMMALGCLFAFNHAGLHAPRDIAIAGFDDIPLARYVHPSLTTMRVDIAELGGRAARILLDTISPRSPAARTEAAALVPQLMVRASSVAMTDSS